MVIFEKMDEIMDEKYACMGTEKNNLGINEPKKRRHCETALLYMAKK